MTDCRSVATFLDAVSARSAAIPVAAFDLGQLQQLGLVDLLTPDQKTQLEQEVAQLVAKQQAIEQEEARRQQEANLVATDTRRTHSILFHLQGVDKQEAEVDQLHTEQEALQALEADLAKREAEFQQLIVKKAELDVMTPYDGQFIAVTTAGRVALRDMTVALYRVGGTEFGTYWSQAKQIDTELDALSAQAARYHVALAGAMAEIDPTYLWAVAIGLAKLGLSPETAVPSFLRAYQAVERLTDNEENKLLTAEVICGLPRPLDDSVPDLNHLVQYVRSVGVPEEAAPGVAAILLAGRRGDGTYAEEPLTQFLRLTASYESAALLAVMNQPMDQLAATFANLKALFASWGYSISEDTELSSAYLTLSGLPAETVGTKMAILSRGVGAYLEYPLVGAAVLASIPVLEANETLNVLEKAYEILGTRTGPLPQATLLTLAVRLVHGVDVRGVSELDPTQVRPAAYPNFAYNPAAPGLWYPVFIAHGAYFATFGGIGGWHPAHVHAVGWGGASGGAWGGGFGG